MRENDEFSSDRGWRNRSESFIPIFGYILPLNRCKKSFSESVCFEILYTASFLVRPFLLCGDFFQISIKGFGKRCVLASLRETKTPRTISDSVVLDQASASAFVSKTFAWVG